jgi:inner membrane protein
MDNLTHAALGLCAGLAVRRKSVPVAAAVTAALVAGELPDIDLLIRSAEDPLVAFRWHRHFTHSFLLWPLLAAGAAWLAAWIFRKREGAGFVPLYGVALAAGLSHVLNDACTSYGTLVLWPFSDARIAWDCLPIIDLTLTLPLVILGIVSWRTGNRGWAVAGAAWFLVYAGMGRLQHDRAETALVAELGERPARLAVKPTVSNLVLWRGIWEKDGEWRTAAIHVGPFGDPVISPGETRRVWNPADPRNPAAGTPARALLDDFNRFTGGWNSIERAEDGGVLVGDIRFAMIPTRASPLWAVHLRQGEPAHFEVRMDRRLREGDWGRFGALLLGRREPLR